MSKIQFLVATMIVGLLSVSAWPSPMPSVARTVIPSDVRQLIAVDYQMAKKFDWAMTLKAQVFPEHLKAVEAALNDVGVHSDRDLDSLTLASFDSGKGDLNRVTIVSGSFTSMAVLTQIGLKKIAPVKSHNYDLYPITKKISLTFLDEHTMVLGSDDALKTVLNVRDGHAANLNSNQQLVEMIKSVERSTVWSVLDQQGTQTMIRLALGDAGSLFDSARIKNHVLGSWYAMNFKNGVKFDTLVFTSDQETANQVSALLKAGMLYKKVTANPEQKVALDNVRVVADRLPVTPDSKVVTSYRPYLRIEFKADRQELQKLLRTHCFTSMSGERQEWSGITSAQPLDLQQ